MEVTSGMLFKDYYRHWVKTYKKGAVREGTYRKYLVSIKHVERLVPNLKLNEITRMEYQQLLNEYAKTHEKETVTGFHHQLRAAILDAVDDDLIRKNPTRKVVIKGKSPRKKKQKYLDAFELKLFLKELNLESEPNIDWLLLLLAKTGMRLGEALGVTKEDFDFERQQLTINKTWNYKDGIGGFQPTKNKSSVRKIRLDWKLMNQFMGLLQNVPSGVPIFSYKKRIFNSTLNNRIKRICTKLDIPVISTHGLRHTHASILIFSGVSIASVSRRLGHADINTTQSVYLHIIREMESMDTDKIMRQLAQL